MNVPIHDVVMVCQMGSRITDEVRYGALRATIEMAKQLVARGRSVLLVGLGDKEAGKIDGVSFAAFPTESALKTYVRSLGSINYLIGISRGDILLMANASRYLIYHHGSHPPQGIDRPTLILTHVPIICVSESSRNEQINYGFCATEVHVVRNGFDRDLFRVDTSAKRHERSLLYAGSIISYKGVDIALNAFGLLKGRFPDATFHLCGRQHKWSAGDVGALPPQWVTGDGFLNWTIIEQDLPGVKYHGEMSQSEVASMLNHCSLLIMCSRVAEPCPLIVLEAQACGCVPVVPNNGGWPEIVNQNISGYLYHAPSNAKVLSDQIAAIWNEDGPMEMMREGAQRWASEFSWDEAGRRFLIIMQSIPPMTITLRLLCRLSFCWQLIRREIVDVILAGWWGLMKWSLPARQAFGLRRS